MRFPKKVIKKIKGNEVKYVEFAMNNFTALFTMVTKYWPSDAVVLATPALKSRCFALSFHSHRLLNAHPAHVRTVPHCI